MNKLVNLKIQIIMNKKLLFAVMSLAALTACTNDELESQKAAEEASPIQFEVINDAVTRASMDENTIVWNANEGDIFTLYHGGVVGAADNYQNATYKANANPGGTATLTSPTMILPGAAIMVWPADTTFRIPAGAGNTLSIVIPAEQTNIENNIPYVSDQIEIAAFTELAANTEPGYNSAGKDRKYPVYMRPMASQLNIKADYAGTDATLESLYTGDDAIDKINVTSIVLSTDDGGDDKFTTEIPVEFTAANANWTAENQAAWNSSWARVTNFKKTDIVAAGQTATLTTTCLTKDAEGKAIGCKFLILPQKDDIAGGVDDGAVVVNTNYGKVVVADAGVAGSLYTPAEAADAWCRYIKEATVQEAYEEKATAAETSGDNQGKFKTTTSIANGLMQTLNVFSGYTAPASLNKIEGEPMGTYANRYVKVLLTHLDMTDLHITSDKQLRDAARVWKKMGLEGVTVYLDGDADEVFEISQNTIQTINDINAGKAYANMFKVMPCTVVDEECTSIVITGGGDLKDIAFIADNGGTQVPVVLKEGENWAWKGTVKIGDGVTKMFNEGTMANAANATLKTVDKDGTQNNIELVNDGTWDITAGTLFVQFDVTNNGEVNISNGAEYRQSGAGHTFVNDATTLEGRFLANPSNEKVGKVNNSGVFATVDNGVINNYGLIEHAHDDAKTYISANQTDPVDFTASFAAANKMGRINLPFSNKNEDNISVTHALEQGFVSVTVNNTTAAPLDASVVGTKVNYVIVNGGVTEIQAVAAQVKYLEINQPGTELAWNVVDATNYTGLMVLSDVNIKLGTAITATSTYLHENATMYVGGTFNKAATDKDMYYGNTEANFVTNYVTY